MNKTGIVILSILAGIVLLVVVGIIAGRLFLMNTFGGYTEHTMAGNTPAQLPDGWPVAFLKLPPDATEEYLETATTKDPGASVSVDKNTKVNGIPAEIWHVGFDSELNWQEMSDFADDCMRGHGFVIIRDDPLGVNPINAHGCEMDFGFRDYVSSDGLTQIRVSYSEQSATALTPGFDGYYYELYILEQPLWPMNQRQTKPIPPASES